MVEHTAKIVQHILTGADPAPGVIGHSVGLVWFHFGINLAVYAGAVVPAVWLLARFVPLRPPAVSAWHRVPASRNVQA
jgi:hypothetical protein